MRKISTYDLLGLPDSVRHTVFVLALLFFLSPYLAGVDLGLVKVPNIGNAVAHAKIIGPMVLAATLLGYAKLWPSKTEALRSKPRPLAYVSREKLRFGLTVGWQLGRFEFVDGSSFPEAQEAAPAIKAEISDLLGRDGFPKANEPLACKELMRSVLLYYSTVDIEKHAAILVGLAAMRVTLIGESASNEDNQEISQLAFSALMEADDSMIPNKRRFFAALLRKPPQTIVELAKVVENACR